MLMDSVHCVVKKMNIVSGLEQVIRATLKIVSVIGSVFEIMIAIFTDGNINAFYLKALIKHKTS